MFTILSFQNQFFNFLKLIFIFYFISNFKCLTENQLFIIFVRLQMHLFKNKTKDVKQFLEEMKANKTNKSSNRNSLEKSNKSVVSSSHSKSPYPSTSFGNANKPNLESRRSNMNSVDSRESNLSVNGSINPSNARISSGGNR